MDIALARCSWYLDFISLVLGVIAPPPDFSQRQKMGQELPKYIDKLFQQFKHRPIDCNSEQFKFERVKLLGNR